MADYRVFLICLVLIQYDHGSVSLRWRANQNTGTRNILTRFKKSKSCPPKDRHSAYGYMPLRNGMVQVEFLIIDQNHIARVKWKAPAATRIPNDGFLVWWSDNFYNRDCRIISNASLTYDIKSSSDVWEYNLPLHLIIVPLPVKAGKYNFHFLEFTPDYAAQTTSAAPNITTSTVQSASSTTRNVKSAPRTWFSTKNMSSTESRSNFNGFVDEYSSKLIIGLVIGVAVGIVFIIIFIRRFCWCGNPRDKKGIFYVYISLFAESEKFVKDVREFVSWLRGNGLDVQMITDESDLLSDTNRNLRREMIAFMFRKHMLETANKVIIILSPTYLKLCQMKEEDVTNQNFSDEEKLVYSEIVQIRCELYDKLYRSDRFIPLIQRQTAGNPFWIKELVFFSWPEDKRSERLLNRLNDLPECPPHSVI